MTPEEGAAFDRWRFARPRLVRVEEVSFAKDVSERCLVGAYRHAITLAWRHLYEARVKRDVAYRDYLKFRSSETDYEDPWFVRYLALREGAEQFRLMLLVLLAVWTGARRVARR